MPFGLSFAADVSGGCCRPIREETGSAAAASRRRKRHLAVDTWRLVLSMVVHSATLQDHEGARFVLVRLQEAFCRINVVFADSADKRNGLPDWVRETCGWTLQTILRPVGIKGFIVLPKRWIVERTIAWLMRDRHHSRDSEKKPRRRPKQ